MSGALVLGEAPRVGRVMRRPVHTFTVSSQPYLLQPFFIAPVLAGETMKNLLLQSRVVTDPVVNPILGWHCEYYFFYVKLTDLDFFAQPETDKPNQSVDVGHRVRMLLADPNFDPGAASSIEQADNPYFYAKQGNQNYVRKCLEVVTEYFFRDENDGAVPWVNNLPPCKINNGGLLDSIKLKSAMTTVDVDLLGDAADAELLVSEVDQALQRYNFMRANGLTDASYSDYLESFGINVPEEKPHQPELIRYVRDWSYPSNTVDPLTGTPTSAVSWSIQERADKSRFFKEPGFLFGVHTTRPKVYLGGQRGAAVGFLDRAEDWLPSQLWGDGTASLKAYASPAGNVGPFNITGDYVVDVRDLYMHGDQFYAGVHGGNLVSLPVAATLQKKYPLLVDIEAFFKGNEFAKTVRQDGIVSLTIASAQRDLTATT